MSAKHLKIFKTLGGGLFLNLNLGEKVEIRHGDETLEIVLCGKSGCNQFKIGFKGPSSFNILRGNILNKNKDGLSGNET